MTAGRVTPRSCAECRYSGSPGVHWVDPAEAHPEFDADELAALEPYSVPCPAVVADDERQRLEAIVADHAQAELTEATRAARKVVTDAAERMVELSANQLRREIAAAQLDKRKGLMGAAFAWAVQHGHIEWTGRTEKSNDPATKGHRIMVYRSLHERWRRAS